MQIRNTEQNDLEQILKIYEYARALMKRTGNPNQWGDNRPAIEKIKEDIEKRQSYIIEDAGEICGIFAFIKGDDPTYAVIEDGAWLNNEPYGVIHRVASNGKKSGVMNCLLEFCESKAGNIRIDTHEDNKIMRSILEKHGYKRCGIIYVDNGTPRIAFQKQCRNGNGIKK